MVNAKHLMNANLVSHDPGMRLFFTVNHGDQKTKKRKFSDTVSLLVEARKPHYLVAGGSPIKKTVRVASTVPVIPRESRYNLKTKAFCY